MGKIAIYPGSFDPITYGHIDIIERATKVFDKVVVAVAYDSGKDSLFSVEERKSFIEKVDWPKGANIEVDAFQGLLVEYVLKKKGNVVVRGLRALSDFEYEFQMALINRKLSEKVETMFLMAGENFSYLSSRTMKEIISLGGSAEAFVPKHVEEALRKKLRK